MTDVQIFLLEILRSGWGKGLRSSWRTVAYRMSALGKHGFTVECVEDGNTVPGAASVNASLWAAPRYIL